MPDQISRAKPVSLGQIGTGVWGQNIIQTVASMPGVELAALTRSQSQFPMRPRAGQILTSDWRELIELDGLDGVIVATPAQQIATIAEAAMLRKLPVFLEKPVALTVESATGLVDVAQDLGSIALVNYIDLCNPAFVAIRDEIAVRGGEEWGKILYFEGQWINSGPFREGVPGRWDYGAHPLAVSLSFVDDEPENCQARRLLASGPGEIIEVMLSWSNGLQASLKFGNGAIEKRREFSIHCENGLLKYDDTAARKAVAGARALDYVSDSPLRLSIARFAKSILLDRSDHSDLDLTLRITTLLKRIDECLA